MRQIRQRFILVAMCSTFIVLFAISETGGSGIGLSVAKAIVEVHNGKIHAESADGKILVITVIL